MFTLPKSTATNRPHNSRASTSGMSLVELMVGVFIGMLTILAIASTIITFEGQRRGTSTGNDAQISATYATYLIERDLRRSGYGLFAAENSSVAPLCTSGTVRAYNQNRSPATFSYDVPTSFVPISINPPNIPAGDANTDIVIVNYTDAQSGGGRCTFFTQSSGASANIKVTNRSGFQTGDISIMVPLTQCPSGGETEIPVSAVASWVDSTKDCSVVEITGLPADTKCDGSGGGNNNNTDVVIHNNGQYNNSYQNCAKIDATRNKPGGLGVDYSPCGVICNLGPQATSMAYAVRGGKLTQCNLSTSPCTDGTKTTDNTVWELVADNIVSLVADMGLAANATSPTVTTWSKTLCTGACTPTYADWQRLKLIRIGILARSPQYQKEAITPNKPKWADGTDINAVTNLDSTNWTHYRYAPIEATVPIRNVIWGSSQ